MALAQEAGTRAPPVTARLACATDKCKPGESNLLAVVLDVPTGWHVYAPCLNDSGLPVTVTPQLPEGWQAQPAPWPTPERLVSPGELLDHVYSGRVTLPLRVLVPPEAAGTRVTLQAHVTWMACKTACVLGQDDVSLAIDVAAAGAGVIASRDEALFHDARTPVALPERAPLTFAWRDKAVSVQAPGAARLEFYPAADCIRLPDLLHDGAREGDVLTLGIERKDESGTGPLRGVVAVHWTAGKSPSFFLVDLSIGQPAASY